MPTFSQLFAGLDDVQLAYMFFCPATEEAWQRIQEAGIWPDRSVMLAALVQNLPPKHRR